MTMTTAESKGKRTVSATAAPVSTTHHTSTRGRRHVRLNAPDALPSTTSSAVEAVNHRAHTTVAAETTTNAANPREDVGAGSPTTVSA
ncbi:hypothetical protein HQO38_21225 [Rhodococcus fascians]|nr:hypothetical protein [Rhodococcus fascians]MBY4139871.1 hypothetical protein [Rhodococcus fascians]MBY4218499.1 hypothetical protein [Rhodococcus fascians]MBY4222163.1 hypothetical protein [Rhodococcus fascians]MBY4234433.1 hypothetical protein [Rhodococcus fascians]